MFGRWALLFVAAALVTWTPLGRGEEVSQHEGVVMVAGSGTLKMVDRTGQDLSFLVDPGAKIVIRGLPATLDQVTPGLRVKATTDKLRQVVAIVTIDQDGSRPASD